jgi:hypothetical protein
MLKHRTEKSNSFARIVPSGPSIHLRKQAFQISRAVHDAQNEKLASGNPVEEQMAWEVGNRDSSYAAQFFSAEFAAGPGGRVAECILDRGRDSKFPAARQLRP